MTAIDVDDADRAAYHAAASIASNFLVTLEDAAERLLATAGVDREALVPLVRATVENWAAAGDRALTGPIARGDDDDRRRASAPRSRSARPSCSTSSTRSPRRPARSPTSWRAHEDASRTVAELRAALADARSRPLDRARADDGLPHEGHPSLIRSARERLRRRRRLAVRQPDAVRRPGDDLAAYPRDEAGDAALAAAAGADILFAPPVDALYPAGFATTRQRRRRQRAARGRPARPPATSTASRPSSTKLLNMVGPDVAFFGQKDAQQALVMRRLVRDLDMPVADRGLPDRARARRPGDVEPQRPPSGDERERALALSRALRAAEAAVAAGERDAGALRAAALAAHARARRRARVPRARRRRRPRAGRPARRRGAARRRGPRRRPPA